MKILQLNPPAVNGVRIVREGRCMQRQEAWGTAWAPLSLAIIASVLRGEGFDVLLKDCPNEDIDVEDLKQYLSRERPDLMMVNTSTPSIDGDLGMARIAKDIDENLITVFFGIHVTALAGRILEENPEVRHIVSGEPEHVLRDFAIAARSGKSFRDVRGLVLREEGRVVHNAPMPYIGNLDEIPFPAWDLVNIPYYRLPITNRPFVLVLISRGCPYPCKFCTAATLYGKQTRLRSPRRIVEEIKYVRDTFGVTDFLFWSENSISDREHMIEISNGLAREVPGVRWVCNGRVDMVDAELLSAMKRGGCWMIGYGVESGIQRVLDLMRKKARVQETERAVALTRQAGIEVTAHVIIGYPGETREEILSTQKLLKRLDVDYIQVYCSVPFPGAPIYEEAVRNGYVNSLDWTRFEQNSSVIDTPQLSGEEVMELRQKIIKDFYLNPRKVGRTLLKVRKPVEVFFFLSFGFRYFLSWVRRARTQVQT
jgi:radical SAM superfamily enzyme YgiQ (UPF0313 family)